MKRGYMPELAIVGMTVGILVLLGALLQPSLTGYVFAEAQERPLNLSLTSSTSYRLKTTMPTQLSSLRLSGEVVGGLVKISLRDNQGNRLLVFSNEKRESENQITGFSVSRSPQLVIEPLKMGDHLPPTPFFEQRFNDECIETCVINKGITPSDDYYLDIEMAEHASVHLDKVSFRLLN